MCLKWRPPIGYGDMGVVDLTSDPELNRNMTIWVLPPD